MSGPPNPYLACNYDCNECGVRDGHDTDCSRAEIDRLVDWQLKDRGGW